jgi:uncharacterized repeat protein (TIGR01451 family)
MQVKGRFKVAFHFRLIAASLLMASLSSNAAVTISIQQSGSDVVATASGSLTMPSCLATSSGTSLGIVYWAASDDYSYIAGQGIGTQCTTSFATAQPLNAVAADHLASANTGGPIGVNRLPSGGNILTVPNGYTSGTSVSSTSTWTGRTLASLNLVPGTYTFDFGTDTITYVVGTLADLSITNTNSVTSATPGGSVTYTIIASNAGPSNVTGATVGDSFPASLTCSWTCAGSGGGSCTASGSGNINDAVNLPSGGTVTYAASCAIAAGATGTLSNTATITAPAGVTDPTPANNAATDSDTLTAAPSVNPIPVFSPWALGLLVLLVAVVATRQQHLRRSR